VPKCDFGGLPSSWLLATLAVKGLIVCGLPLKSQPAHSTDHLTASVSYKIKTKTEKKKKKKKKIPMTLYL
jgi:hypothetical protein